MENRKGDGRDEGIKKEMVGGQDQEVSLVNWISFRLNCWFCFGDEFSDFDTVYGDRFRIQKWREKRLSNSEEGVVGNQG
jgi:hypothetical protein